MTNWGFGTLFILFVLYVAVKGTLSKYIADLVYVPPASPTNANAAAPGSAAATPQQNAAGSGGATLGGIYSNLTNFVTGGAAGAPVNSGNGTLNTSIPTIAQIPTAIANSTPLIGPPVAGNPTVGSSLTNIFNNWLTSPAN
ncbi:MAG: hypothetical protein WDN46_12935 [Methylocella sp.]